MREGRTWLASYSAKTSLNPDISPHREES